jgi:secreted Zn-dependent insulinase-like peptidase
MLNGFLTMLMALSLSLSLFLSGICRFAQFFLSPLVKVEAMDREVQAIDSGTWLQSPTKK